MPTWLIGDLIDVLGSGVVAAALETARREDRTFAPASGYFDAIEAELRLRQGEDEEALRLAEKAWRNLPSSEVPLGARVSVIAALACESLDRGRDALVWWERAAQKDPGVFRRMGVAIPGHVRGVGGDVAEEAAAMIARSPRFRDAQGFEVVVETIGPALRTCLRAPSGALLSCTTAQPQARVPAEEGKPPPPAETDSERAQRMQEEFLRAAFGPKLTGPGADLRSLDGSTLPSESRNREQLQQLLEHAQEQP